MTSLFGHITSPDRMIGSISLYSLSTHTKRRAKSCTIEGGGEREGEKERSGGERKRKRLGVGQCLTQC